MKLAFLFWVLLSVSKLAQCQNDNSCQIINAILHFESAKRMYYFDRPISREIVFYDTTNFFQHCKFENIYNKEVRLSHNRDSAIVQSASTYLIYDISNKAKKASLRIYYKHSGAICTFVLKRKKKIWYVKELRESYI